MAPNQPIAGNRGHATILGFDPIIASAIAAAMPTPPSAPGLGLFHFLDDDRLEMDANPAERQIQRMALTHGGDAVFVGYEGPKTGPCSSRTYQMQDERYDRVTFIAENLGAILDGHLASCHRRPHVAALREYVKPSRAMRLRRFCKEMRFRP